MTLNIGISEDSLKKTTKALNVLLADEHLLYIKTRSYHWNVVAPNFSEMHNFFESQYDELETIIDNLAERIRQLGHFAQGSLKYFADTTRLSENEPADSVSSMVQNLLNDHETIIRTLREDVATIDEKYKDAGTADFLTSLMEQHEKMAWMLRSYLK